MMREEYEALIAIEAEEMPRKTPSVRALGDETKTLIFGYDLNRNTFHLFQHHGKLHRLVYNHSEEVLEHDIAEEMAAALCFPSKRIYPERSDFEFIKRLKELGYNPSITKFNDAAFNMDQTLLGFTDVDELELERSSSTRPGL